MVEAELKINVLLLGPARLDSGADRVALEMSSPATVGDVRRKLATMEPRLGMLLAKCRLAVNRQFAADDQSVADGDEIAVIPPVSGGAGDDWIGLVEQPIDVSAIRAFVMSVDGEPFGGVCMFEGCTRAETHAEHGRLRRLEYESYDQMAVSQMQSIADSARKRWPIVRLALVHRVGAVPIGEPSVVIAVTCAHRAEAFEACRWLIDTLKHDVPIWKREIWESGESTWVDPTKCC